MVLDTQAILADSPKKFKKSKKKKASLQVIDISKGLVISNDNLFAEKLNSLKEFSDQYPAEINLPTVAIEGGLFGWFDHTVTGSELNRLNENIQNRMIEQNTTVVKVLKEIACIYDTFAALDKVYVQEIVLAINTACKAIDEVRGTNERIGEQQKEISGAQQDIQAVIHQQKQIIQILKNFKEKLENLKHLYDIDRMFQAVHALQTAVEALEQAYAMQKNEMDQILEMQKGLQGAQDKNNKKISKMLDEQKADLMHLSATQTEASDKLSLLQEADKTIREALVLSAQNVEQQISEIRQYTEKRFSGMELTAAKSGKQYEDVKTELAALRDENAALFKSLTLFKSISIAGLGSSLLVFILFLTEVLR